MGCPNCEPKFPKSDCSEGYVCRNCVTSSERLKRIADLESALQAASAKVERMEKVVEAARPLMQPQSLSEFESTFTSIRKAIADLERGESVKS